VCPNELTALGSPSTLNVAFWHKADIRDDLIDVRFRRAKAVFGG